LRSYAITMPDKAVQVNSELLKFEVVTVSY